MHIISDVDLFNKINEATKMSFGRDYFVALGEVIQEVSHADYTFLTKIDNENNIAYPIVSFHGGILIENESYEMETTPCIEVKDTCVGFYPNNVQGLFPDDHYLRTVDVEGYIGVSIVPIADEPPVGLLTCLYEDSSDFSAQFLKIIELVSNIIQARIEREILIHEKQLVIEERDKFSKELKYSNSLLKEIHHRIKNNLHIITGLLKLQGLESGNKNIENYLDSTAQRIISMALIHEKIYEDNSLDVSLEEYLNNLSSEIIRSANSDIKVVISSEVILIRPEPLSTIAMIINELIVNVIKYAFKETLQGVIEINVLQNKDDIVINFKDNGKWVEPKEEISIGSTLIDIFTSQLNGKYVVDTKNGTSYKFTFPKEK